MSEHTESLTEFDRQLVEAFDAYQEHGTTSGAAAALGVPRHTYTNRLLRYFLRGLDTGDQVRPGHVIKTESTRFDADGNVISRSLRTGLAPSEETFEVPEGHRVHAGTYQIDGNNQIERRWLRVKEGERDILAEIEKAARLAAELYVKPAEPLDLNPLASEKADPNLLNLHLLPDLHIGLQASALTGQRDWSLDRAITVYRKLFRLLVERAPFAGTGVILGGGDLLHYDDDTKMTRRSGNVLDGAEPYDRVLAEAEMLLVYHVEIALQKYPKVLVRILKGNHDPDSAIAVAHFLAAWFRNEPRVTVDVDPSLVWVHQHGKVLLGATHGHELRTPDLPGVMAADHRAAWGESTMAYAHGFHVHHGQKGAGVDNGTPWETHAAPVPRDGYHQGKGYRGPQSLPVITYHATAGETGRTLETIVP